MSALSKETIDRLTPWLLSNLHSDDLDAKDMADYVVSLVSAPGTQEQLYNRCRAELQEFLGDKTTEFVDALFQEISRLNQGEQAPPSQTFTAPNGAEPQQQIAPSEPMSGGQQEFRRNFRSDFSPFVPNQRTPQQAQQSHPTQQPHPGQQWFPTPQGIPADFPMAPPPGMQGPGMPPFPNMPQQGMPPQFGFQGFGRPERQFGRNNANHNGKHNQRNKLSSISSIQNELSVANRRLVVESIPEENLNKESIEQFFGKFGRITDIKIVEQQRLAEIEFEGHDQAVQAHKSPEPIFGNRFVKVFWRKRSETEQEPELDVEAVRRMQAIKQQQFEEREAKRKALTTQLRSAMNEQGEVLRQRQELLQSGQANPDIMNQLQTKSEELTNQLKQLKQELAVIQGGSNGKPGPGGPSRGAFRGRGGRGASPYSRGGRAPRGSFRGGYGAPYGGAQPHSGSNRFQGASLDRRPKGVLIQGLPADKDEVLRSELASRSYTDYQRQADDSVVVDFADRRSAEEFFNHEIPELGSVTKAFVRVDANQATPDSTMDEA